MFRLVRSAYISVGSSARVLMFVVTKVEIDKLKFVGQFVGQFAGQFVGTLYEDSRTNR